MLRCLQETSGRAWITHSWTDLSALDCFMKFCWHEQIQHDPGVLQLEMARPNARSLGLRSTPIDDAFGKQGTKVFESFLDSPELWGLFNLSSGSDQSLHGWPHAWVLRARFGAELPCVDDPCVPRGAEQSGKHVVLEGEQLKVSVHQMLRDNTWIGALL